MLFVFLSECTAETVVGSNVLSFSCKRKIVHKCTYIILCGSSNIESALKIFKMM